MIWMEDMDMEVKVKARETTYQFLDLPKVGVDRHLARSVISSVSGVFPDYCHASGPNDQIDPDKEK